MNYRRNDEALKTALEDHTVDGYEVVVPVFGEGTIVDQLDVPMRQGSPMSYYLVEAKKSVPFDQWVLAKGPNRGTSPNEQLNLEEWKSAYGQRMIPIPDYLMRLLEQGRTLSWADVEHDSLEQRNCLDSEDRVRCYTFFPSEVSILPEQLRRGMIVEYIEEGKEFQGIIIGFSKDRKVAYLELFTPLPYNALPQAISNEDIQSSFYPEVTFALGYGVHEALRLAEEESGESLIPAGKWDNEDPWVHEIYTLKEFMPISVVKEICDQYYGGQPHCLLQSLILYVAPIVLEGVEVKERNRARHVKGRWRPLPEKAIPMDVIQSYEEEDEG